MVILSQTKWAKKKQNKVAAVQVSDQFLQYYNQKFLQIQSPSQLTSSHSIALSSQPQTGALSSYSIPASPVHILSDKSNSRSSITDKGSIKEMTEVAESIEPMLPSKQESTENTSVKSNDSKDPKMVKDDIKQEEEDIKSTHSSANLSWAEDDGKLTKHVHIFIDALLIN